ncbi:MAG: hypothetical protein GY853_09665 [PVC group bacterium]|nr:hypothetical protein [PVC group bacterium]
MNTKVGGEAGVDVKLGGKPDVKASVDVNLGGKPDVKAKVKLDSDVMVDPIKFNRPHQPRMEWNDAKKDTCACDSYGYGKGKVDAGASSSLKGLGKIMFLY